MWFEKEMSHLLFTFVQLILSMLINFHMYMYLKKTKHLFDYNFKALFIDTAFKVMGHKCQWQCSKRDI